MYKVIIAEDETLIREGIHDFLNSLDGVYEVLGAAADGREALDLITTHRPDILITDILMPHMDGLELINESLAVLPELKVIIISGHSEFSYAQSAMRLGVSEYLIKPILPNEIEKALEQVQTELQKRENFLKNLDEMAKSLEDNLPALRERFLTRLLSSTVSEKEARERAAFLKLDIAGRFFAVVLLKLSNSTTDSNEQRAELTEVLILKIAQSMFPKGITVHPLFVAEKTLALILCLHFEEAAAAFAAVNQSVTKMLGSFRGHFKVNMTAAIGRLYPTLENLQYSYGQAKEALDYAFLDNTSAVINYEDIRLHPTSLLSRPDALVSELLISVKFDSIERALTLVSDIFECYAKQESQLLHKSFIKMEVLEIAMTLMRSVDELMDGDSAFRKAARLQLYDDVEKTATLIQLEDVFTAFVRCCWDQYRLKRLGRTEVVFNKMCEYVDLHYMEESFSLDDIAAALYMSANYLRQIFKQYQKESFVEYLTRVRMEKAAELLNTGDVLVQDVARRVGYENQRYFAILFKKHHKVTPSEYRLSQN
jgi:Response regulator containing CheY-like receiver domain and AraC-type DNA-binding domain